MLAAVGGPAAVNPGDTLIVTLVASGSTWLASAARPSPHVISGDQVSALAPRNLLAAQALDSDGDPQLAKGVHLRVMPSAEPGLPAAPFLVYRMRLGFGAQDAQLRSDIVWATAMGRDHRTFYVMPDNPVTGYLPPATGGVCCWIEGSRSPTRLLAVAPHQRARVKQEVVSGPGRAAGCRCARWWRRRWATRRLPRSAARRTSCRRLEKSSAWS